MTSDNDFTRPKASLGSLSGKGRISIRFRNINIMLFILAFCIMAMVMATAFNGVIRKISSDYAKRYAVSSAETLSAHIVRQLGLMAKAAHSSAVIEWLADENNNEKKSLAYKEMASILRELYSNNLYVGLEKTRHEYKVEENYTVDNIVPFTVLEENNPDATWYFECIESNHDYMLTIGIDHVLQRKRVWINYKVVQGGVTLGVICTGLEFSHVAGELFSQYENRGMRGFIIDKDGIIKIDSSLIDNQDILNNDGKVLLKDTFSDPVSLAAIQSYLDNIEGYFEAVIEPASIELPAGRYRYMTIAPIRHTNWSVAILYDSSPLLNMTLFLPIAVTMLVVLIAFALAANAVSYRLIFLPLGKLEDSLARLKESSKERVYGIERNDELGNLANTIQDLFTKAHYDALTGIYNRRFMENNFQQIMELLSRSNALLSVLMLDVDYFKKYNDTYGHEQGDACLKAIAWTMAGGMTRTHDFAARYGGEEFVAVLPNTDEAGARMIAEKLLKNVRELNIPHAGSLAAPYVTVSIGVTTGQVAYMQLWEDYVKRADEALYIAKQNGRNRYTCLDFIGGQTPKKSS